jgi:hypothetical protein
MAPVNNDALAVRKSIRLALDCRDAVWYRYMLKKDICGSALTDEEARTVVAKAVETAAQLAGQVATKYKGLGPEQCAAAMGLKLAYTDEELTAAYARIGLYQPDSRTIVLNSLALSKLERFIDDNGLSDLTPPEDVPRVAIFHEIFHALEEENPAIYTSSRIRRKTFGLFPRMQGLRSASEVGAVHFSKCLAGIAYSPCLFESYLLLALGRLSIDFLPPKM